MKRLCLLLAALALLLLLGGCSAEDVTPNWAGQEKTEATEKTDASGWQAQYDLGVRYLNDGNYEEAVIAFTAAIEIDPKKPDGYLRLADAYMGQGDTASALRTLRDGADAAGGEALTERAYTVKEDILENNPELTGLPAAVVPGEEGQVTDGPRLYRSVILADRDGEPVQLALVAGIEKYGGDWKVVRYRAGEDGRITGDALFTPHTEGGRTDVIVYYDAKLDCICAASVCTYSGTQSGANGYSAVIYTVADTVQEYRSWDWNNIVSAANGAAYGDGIDQMQAAGLPYFPSYFEKNYANILDAENLASCCWLYKHDSFNDFNRADRERDGWMAEWTQEELSDFEDSMHKRARSLLLREEKLREAEKYRIEQRPELRPADADYCFGEETAETVYGGFALVRKSNEREIATFCIAFQDIDSLSFAQNEDELAVSVEPVERCIVYSISDGTADGCRFSFDPETEKLYALRSGRYTVYGDYLVQIDSESAWNDVPRSCRLLTVRGTELETLMEDVYQPECYVHGDTLYLSFSDATYPRPLSSVRTFTIERYTIQEKKTEYIMSVDAWGIVDVGDGYIDFYTFDSAEKRQNDYIRY